MIHKCIALLFIALFFFQPLALRKYIYSHIYNYTYSWVYDPAADTASISFAHHRILFCAVTTVIHTGVFVGMNLLYALCYVLQHPSIEQYKSDKTVWPWQSESKSKRDEYWSLLYKSVALVAFIQLIFAPIVAYVTFAMNDKFFTWTPDELPSTLTQAWQLFSCMVIDDALFYWLHRALHTKYLYFIHKKHHHFKATVGIASEFTSMGEAMLLGLPFVAGPQLLGIYCYTYYLWLALRIFQSVDAHCGYEFPWIPFTLFPYVDTASNHSLHHLYSTGNYSSFFDIWDRMCGTVIQPKYKAVN